MKKGVNNNIALKKWVIVVALFCFLLIFVRTVFIALSPKVDGINLKEFAKGRNTKKKVIEAGRGTIYDKNGEILAINVSSYTLIAYLDDTRTTNINKPNHVVDIDYTAKSLAKVINLKEKEIKKILSQENLYQVEFGYQTKYLTELEKEAIESLDLPGIDFVESQKRYYPNGDFLSYTLGYAKSYTRINIKVDEEYDLYNLYNNYFDNNKTTITISKEEIISIDKTKIKGLKKGSVRLSILNEEKLSLADIIINVVDNVDVRIDNAIVGELGIEQLYNDELKGENGYVLYQQDASGYKIAGTHEEKIEEIDGNDIYLTIDSNIEFFVEQALNESFEKYKPEWMTLIVADAKTGAILASSSKPSYNPNPDKLNVTNYNDYALSLPYEPGSTMKTYAYMLVMEKGLYDGNKKYKSGSFKADSNTKFYDWKKSGWGNITYDFGYRVSSNTGVDNLIKEASITSGELREYYEKLGFGKKTGIELSNEAVGNLDFRYDAEFFAAAFGQGITTTPIQHIKALTSLSNGGDVLKPYIISKIVDKDNNIIYEGKREVVDTVASITTVNKMKDLMWDVINNTSGTGSSYKIKGYDIIGKTGTAQLYNTKTGTYYNDDYNVIRSVSLMYPKDDPEIIIYAAAKKVSTSKALSEPIKSIIKNTSKYLNIFGEEEGVNANYEVENFTNKKKEVVIRKLEESLVNYIVLGDGDKIINQSIKKGVLLNENDTIILLTNTDDYEMPDLSNLSKKTVKSFCSLTNITCVYEGDGYVKSQSIKKGEKITEDMSLTIKLEDKYKKQTK